MNKFTDPESIGLLAASLIGFFSVLIYFLPAMIGMSKKKSGAIFALNLLAGWTAIGWVAAFIWACVEQYKKANIKAWIYLFIGSAAAAALFSGLACLFVFFVGDGRTIAKGDYFLLIDAGVFFALGFGVGLIKSRVCAVLMFLYLIVPRFMVELDATVMLAIIFGMCYLLGIVGTFTYQHRRIISTDRPPDPIYS